MRILQRPILKFEHRNLPERCRHDNRTGNTPADLHPFVSNVQFLYSCTFPPVRVSYCLGEGAVSSVCVGSRAPGSGAGGVPGSLDVLALQDTLQLFELCHRLILHIGVWDLQPDAVRGPAQLSGEHLCQDPGHHRNHLRTKTTKNTVRHPQVSGAPWTWGSQEVERWLGLCVCIPHSETLFLTLG